MRVKMLAALAVSSLLAASVGFAAPDMDVVAEDVTPGVQAPMDGSTNNANGAMQNPGNDLATPGNMGTNNGPTGAMPSDSGAANSNDDMSADTATGDDDY